MAEAQKKVKIRKINRCVQKIWSHHKRERIKTAGYKDKMGDNLRDLIESDDNIQPWFTDPVW